MEIPNTLINEFRELKKQGRYEDLSKITNEKERFESEIKTMEKFLALSSTLRERLQKSSILDYFNDAKKIAKLDY